MDEVISIIGIIGVVIYFITKHRETLEKLNIMQKIGILITYIITSFITGFIIYYGGAYLKEWFECGMILTIIQFAFTIIILFIAITILNLTLTFITKGVFQDNN